MNREQLKAFQEAIRVRENDERGYTLLEAYSMWLRDGLPSNPGGGATQDVMHRQGSSPHGPGEGNFAGIRESSG